MTETIPFTYKGSVLNGVTDKWVLGSDVAKVKDMFQRCKYFPPYPGLFIIQYSIECGNQ